jgi:hypothetical protein
MQTKEERKRKRRERYARKKEWEAILERWVAFAEYIVLRKQQERESRGKQP